MMSLNNQTNRGIVIKKIRYKEYHEILHILTENSTIESFFYENVHKNKKKLKVMVPNEVVINYIPTSGMKKIITLDVEEYYSDLIYDVIKNGYISNIVEYIAQMEFFEFSVYKLFKKCLEYMREDISLKLIMIYFILKILPNEGFTFKYQKNVGEYTGYSFEKSLFISKEFLDRSTVLLTNKQIKLIYYLGVKNDDFIYQLDIPENDESNILTFLISIMKEYVGITTKSYDKIIELEEIMKNIK